MIKIKRLKNLKLIKSKNLNMQRNEVITLSDELEKTNNLKQRLENILTNVKKKNFSNARELRETNNFNIKIINQIRVTENRAKFLEIELRRARINLGKIMQQKKIINDKINSLIKINMNNIEKKIADNTPNVRKT